MSADGEEQREPARPQQQQRQDLEELYEQPISSPATHRRAAPPGKALPPMERGNEKWV